MSKVIVGLGEVLWDVLPEGKKMGGAPANFAYHVSQFGMDGWVISAIGNDKLGEEIWHNLANKHMRFLTQKVDFPTGTVEVSLDKEGIPQYNIRENVAWDNIPFTPEMSCVAHRCDAVCFGTLSQRSPVSRMSITKFLDIMPQGEDYWRIFDINLRQHFYSKEIVEDGLRRCNILKINDEELVIVSEMFGLDGMEAPEQCRKLIDLFGLRMLILTCGETGSYVFSGTDSSFFSTPRVTVADTVGAGDSFTAAFIASILRGDDLRTAHKKAVDVSAYVCTQHGAMPLLPKNLTE